MFGNFISKVKQGIKESYLEDAYKRLAPISRVQLKPSQMTRATAFFNAVSAYALDEPEIINFSTKVQLLVALSATADAAGSEGERDINEFMQDLFTFHCKRLLKDKSLSQKEFVCVQNLSAKIDVYN
ncbi:hypothetical protein [Paraferrimonas sp. SM1919]|uniref:hypothetical protein n=1 Tax=Paraferrimonas sp. SM1919 TaxID=2662263 RepID=UPI0013D139A9|nr:hypothetical protein [Paraferrimonas sp. SM1919]